MLFLLFAGCAEEKRPALVKLEVSRAGSYFVDGSAVDRSRLVEVLQSKHQSDQKLHVYIKASQDAKDEAVRAAVAACKEVGAGVAVIGTEEYVPNSPAASGS